MKLVQPTLESRTLLINHGYQSVAHVPVLLGGEGDYPELMNRYMRARALREWIPRMGTYASEPKPRLGAAMLSVKTLEAIGRKLCLFHDWLNRKNQDPLQLNYSDLLEWQDELINAGEIRTSVEAKKHSTANAYVSEGCLYLTWLSLVPKNPDGSALRPPFEVLAREDRVEYYKGDRAHKTTMLVESRLGALAIRPTRITLPSDQAIVRWLRAMNARSEIKALMSEVALDSGMRISEINQMVVDTLPPADEWRTVGGRVHFWISRGVKGPKVRPDSVVAIRGREVSLSLPLARKIDHYRKNGREIQIRRWIRSAINKSEQARRAGSRPQRLWLSEYSNAPFANQQLRDTWGKSWCAVKRVMPSEPDTWCPHRARHWFAVELLVNAALARQDAQGRGVPELTWLEGIMRDHIDLLIRPELGHLSDATTRLYLRAALLKLEERFGSPSVRWQDYADQEDS